MSDSEKFTFDVNPLLSYPRSSGKMRMGCRHFAFEEPRLKPTPSVSSDQP